MGIVDWYVNDLNSDERVLTRDLISVAVADKEFVGEEKNAILEICQIEDISNTDLINSIRENDTEVKAPKTLEEKKTYLLHLIKVMSVDKEYPSLELHIIEIIGKRIGITPLQLVSFILDEINNKNINQEEGITIIDKFVKHMIITGAKIV